MLLLSTGGGADFQRGVDFWAAGGRLARHVRIRQKSQSVLLPSCISVAGSLRFIVKCMWLMMQRGSAVGSRVVPMRAVLGVGVMFVTTVLCSGA